MKYMSSVPLIVSLLIAFPGEATPFTKSARLNSPIAQTSNAATTKDFEFDVVSIREIQSGYGPRQSPITPDGYRAGLTVGWMIKYAYGRGDPMPLPNADGGVFHPPSREDIAKTGFLQQRFYNASMADLASFLNLSSDRPIYDKTGLGRGYDFTVNQLPLQPEDAANILGLFQIKDLGLSLRPGKGPGLDLTIDHIDKPTPN